MAKVIGFLVCGKGEADRYLEGTLKEFQRLCDDAVVVGNNTDKKTEKMIKDYDYHFYRDDREWGKHQPEIKTKLLTRIGTLNPDWVIPLDADEVFDEKFNRTGLEKLIELNALAYHCYIVNLWNTPDRYWRSACFWNVRMFRYAPEWGIGYLKKNVHCGLAPPYAYYHGSYAPVFVAHYGLMKKEDRDKKIKRYEKYDPNGDKVGIGQYYEALKATDKGSEFNKNEVRNKLKDYCMGIKPSINAKNPPKPKEKKFAIVKRIADGATLDMPWDNWERRKNTGLFELVRTVSTTPNASVTVPIIEDDDKEWKKFKKEKGV